MIIGIIGKKRSGKDTIGDYLTKYYGFTSYSFANPIKLASKHLFGFTDDQLYGDLKDEIDYNWGVTPRTVFQIMGTEIFQQDMLRRIPELQKNGRKHWVKLFKMWYDDQVVLKEAEDGLFPFHVVVPDVRFEHEAQGIREMGGILIKVDRPCPDSLNKDNHASEIELEYITNYDYQINNDGTKSDLYEKIDSLFLLIKENKKPR